MTVSIGNIITAAQYNTLIDNINKWFGDNYPSNTPASSKATSSFGWGNVNAPSVALNQLITAEQSNHLINRINLGKLATGAGSNLSKIIVGNTILASDYNNIENQSNIIANNRLNTIDATITSGGTNGSAARGSWSNSITVTCTATFPSYAAARYFFNSGGQLRFSFNVTGTTSDAQAWDDLFDGNDMGTLIFSYNDIAQTGTRPGNIISGSGFYELTTSQREIYNINLDISPYTSNDLRMYAYRNSTGTQVIIRFVLNNDDGNAETVNGTTYIYLDHRKADNKSASDPSVNFSIPSFSSFSAGSWSGS